ncbi:class I glutamine amidotransferase-like protein [Crepidotus variabilis]|uniref:Class I glutamine amidotransferase-like protein n=1 Tax=Crepidotus variabilis TaxID=179855 RepID=A0A9P6EFI1_9AGAR|nr:class I glutamine amidotransferase-like protein [Crepidotus variabilis]
MMFFNLQLSHLLLSLNAVHLAYAVDVSPTATSSPPTATSSTPGDNSTALPLNYGVVLFPGFQALDVFGPLDVFNSLAINYTMNLFIIAETLDPVSTKHPMSMPGTSNFNEAILPTHTFANPPESLDVLLVPGGGGTRVAAPGLDAPVKFITDTYPTLQYLISVCTGVGLVARTGILDGLAATGNKKAWAWVIAQGPNVNWVTHARWVHTKNIWTTSGISAGLDGTYDFVRTVYGEDVGVNLANNLEYSPIMDWKDDKFADLYNLTNIN